MNTVVSSLMSSASCSTRERDPTNHAGAWLPGDRYQRDAPTRFSCPSAQSLIRSGVG